VDAGETGVIEETYEHHHPPTSPLDTDGQGDAHVSYVFAAHRAVVDVDLDLGLVRVVEIATSQDVGRVLNPLQVTGQIEGGIAQGVGLGRDGGDRARPRARAERVVHRLPDPDGSGHA
jgi:CO/xanthine dehydrogenase Mo-binding subunit